MTTNEASERLGVGPQYIRYLIAHGHLQAVRFGRDWWIEETDLIAYQSRPPRPRGWPKGRKRA